VEFIDGHPVTDCRVRFRLRAIVEAEHADAVRDGDVIIWVVRARCLPPQYFEVTKDSDERYKLAIQDVEDAVPLTGESRAAAIAFLDGGRDQLTLPFDAPDEPIESSEVAELRLLLDDLGGIGDGETLADAVARLTHLDERAPTGAERHLDSRLSDDEYAAAYARATAVLHTDDDPAGGARPTEPPVDGDVEVIGSIYRGGRSELAALLNEKFGDT
jgi:hypothetical protein